MIATPTSDKIIQGFSLKDKSGRLIDFAQGKREIMERILNRAAPDGKKRLHIMTHTRFGKSAFVGAAVAVASNLKSGQLSQELKKSPDHNGLHHQLRT